MNFKTADLCDEFGNEVQVTEPLLQDFGGKITFAGPIVTVDVFEDNVLVRKQLEQPGEGRVLVVDGGGSLLTALLGDQLATLAKQNGWAGIVVHGCIRDAEEVAHIPIGVKALSTNPRRSRKQGRGTTNRPVHFGGITFRPGQYLYADRDGIIIADRDLLAARMESARTESARTESARTESARTESAAPETTTEESATTEPAPAESAAADSVTTESTGPESTAPESTTTESPTPEPDSS